MNETPRTAPPATPPEWERFAQPNEGIIFVDERRYYAVRHEGIPDGLIRRDFVAPGYPRFERLTPDGQWVEDATLITGIREWNVDPIDELEAERIAIARGAFIRRS
jgi:hypothetical protein